MLKILAWNGSGLCLFAKRCSFACLISRRCADRCFRS
ncbi:hypothetical protein NKG99_34900 [Mesorhizobium sp. M1409]